MAAAATAAAAAAAGANFGMNWEAITIEFVEQNCGGSSLYCGRCGEFHDRDAFSSGRNGQQRANPRFCLRGAPV